MKRIGGISLVLWLAILPAAAPSGMLVLCRTGDGHAAIELSHDGEHHHHAVSAHQPCSDRSADAVIGCLPCEDEQVEFQPLLRPTKQLDHLSLPRHEPTALVQLDELSAAPSDGAVTDRSPPDAAVLAATVLRL